MTDTNYEKQVSKRIYRNSALRTYLMYACAASSSNSSVLIVFDNWYEQVSKRIYRDSATAEFFTSPPRGRGRRVAAGEGAKTESRDEMVESRGNAFIHSAIYHPNLLITRLSGDFSHRERGDVFGLYL